MAVISFPPVSHADEDGLLAVGGDLEVGSLVRAYRSGIFPWPLSEEQLLWFAPPQRAVLFFDEFHVPRRLLRSVKHRGFSTQQDTAFRIVITKCAEVANRGEQQGTWITEEMIEAYCALHAAGYAHSFEAYQGSELVGGIYGVRIGRLFAAESSFYRVSDASKVAMCFLVDSLRAEGLEWMDCQVLTPFSSSFGAREIPRDRYMELLEGALL